MMTTSLNFSSIIYFVNIVIYSWGKWLDFKPCKVLQYINVTTSYLNIESSNKIGK